MGCLINLKKRGRKLYRNNDSNIYDSSKEVFFTKEEIVLRFVKRAKANRLHLFILFQFLLLEKRKKTEGKENFLKTRYTNNTQALSFPRKSFEKYRTSHEREIKRMLS